MHHWVLLVMKTFEDNWDAVIEGYILGCLETFLFGTFTMLFLTNYESVGHEHSQDEWYIDTKVY